MEVENGPRGNERLESRKFTGELVKMERIAMVVSTISRPFSTIARVCGRISATHPEEWCRPNTAIRLEVGEEDGQAITRVYTIRQFNKDMGLLEIDFMLHGDGKSPAMRWLCQARTGSVIYLTGPRQHFMPDFKAKKPLVFFADETAVPAIFSILSQWPHGIEALFHLESSDPGQLYELPQIDGVIYDISIKKNNEKSGSTGFLVKAAHATKNADAWVVWAACEREEARAIRRYFLQQGAPRENIMAIGYWRRGTSSSKIDAVRQKHYAKLLASGKGLEALDELDLPI